MCSYKEMHDCVKDNRMGFAFNDESHYCAFRFNAEMSPKCRINRDKNYDTVNVPEVARAVRRTIFVILRLA